ncbi:hypothetical protein ACJIZ3_020385 [Penstemon smallii]|uniref:Uncharacterized protein n=1 Tax=Penstemon smallii TaxID=265156 RepID=A0ABD3SIY9_9LAMI
MCSCRRIFISSTGLRTMLCIAPVPIPPRATALYDGGSSFATFGSHALTEANGAAMPRYRAQGPSLATALRRILKADPLLLEHCCCLILNVSSGYPAITPAVPPNPPATNSLPQLSATEATDAILLGPIYEIDVTGK